jgi:hypothetical protein
MLNYSIILALLAFYTKGSEKTFLGAAGGTGIF